MPVIVINRMNAETVEAVARLESRCFSMPWSLTSLKSELENPLAVFLTAAIGGEVVGYAGMHDVKGEGYVTNIAVFPEHRRQGIAKTLMESLLEYGEENGLTMITLEVRGSNEAAIRLYCGLGFEETGRRKSFYTKPVEDGIIMTRRLI